MLLQQLMNFSYNATPYFLSPQQMSFLYAQAYHQYEYPQFLYSQPRLSLSPKKMMEEVNNSHGVTLKHKQLKEQGSDDDEQELVGKVQRTVKNEQKWQQQQNIEISNKILKQNELKLQNQNIVEITQVAKQKNLKKNTESNLINNVFSYICSQWKSHRVVSQMIKDNPDKVKIFYIFSNNFKRINGKYLNRKNIKSICQIAPKQLHFKILSKSIKRLLILPMKQFRILLRKLIFNYLRGPDSILPLLTSKKIFKKATLQHLKRRRQLYNYMQSEIKDYN